MSTLQCKMCTVHTLIAKQYTVRMIIKSEFMPACQSTALYLEKQNSLKNSAKCALCSAKCALCSCVRSDLTTPFKASKKDVYAENFRKEKKMLQRLKKT